MSAWGTGVAENDDAADWLSDLAEEASLGSVEDALNEVADAEEGEYLEVTDCANAVAAAAVFADLLDGNGELETERYDVPLENLRAALEQRGQEAVYAMGTTALCALKRVKDREDSELLDLWEDAEDRKAWTAKLGEIGARIERNLPSGKSNAR